MPTSTLLMSFSSQSEHPVPNPFTFEFKSVDDLTPSTKEIIRKSLKLVNQHWITCPEELMLLRALDVLIKDLFSPNFRIKREARLFIHRSSRYPFEYPISLAFMSETLQLCPVILERELLSLMD